MEYALKKFKERVYFIEKQFYSQGVIESLLSTLVEKERVSKEDKKKFKEVCENKTDEKIYYYTANIISLYGGLESYIEGVVDEYIKSITLLFPSYKKMIEITGIRDCMQKGVSLLNHAEERKFKNLSKNDVLIGLYKSVIKDDSRALLSEAFVDFGGGNYKHETIMNCLVRMGLKDIKSELKRFDPLRDYIDKKGLDSSSNLFTKIDDLVERRNELAHGADNLELIDTESFLEYITFLSTYVETINNYLDNRIKYFRWEREQCDIIEPRVFTDNIVCLRSGDVELGTEYRKGQSLLLQRDGKFYDGEIENIRVEERDYDYYKKEQIDTEIGLKVKSKCIITKDSKIKIVS